MNSKTVTMSRDLAERLDSPHSSVRNAALESLRRIIAAPVVERQEPSHWADAYDNTITASHKSHNEKLGGAPAMVVERYTQPLYTSPPAPVAVVLPERNTASKNLDLEQCGYVDGWNACLDKVKEMNR